MGKVFEQADPASVLMKREEASAVKTAISQWSNCRAQFSLHASSLRAHTYTYTHTQNK